MPNTRPYGKFSKRKRPPGNTHTTGTMDTRATLHCTLNPNHSRKRLKRRVSIYTTDGQMLHHEATGSIARNTPTYATSGTLPSPPVAITSLGAAKTRSVPSTKPPNLCINLRIVARPVSSATSIQGFSGHQRPSVDKWH
ncbi:hypothetical protein E2C01_038000 [Portunus trituberculatus]|uniref:Uncharacterized protein n=1 Tax=Portunus trituberculatus TaxID=210409 RepID=A0A5B7FFM3_PORTR|nr:hypothetical protein [Portunus trituberculatus]